MKHFETKDDPYDFMKHMDIITPPKKQNSAELSGSVNLADMFDRLSCMAREKDLAIEGPYLSDILKDSALKDAEVLRKCARIISALE